MNTLSIQFQTQIQPATALMALVGNTPLLFLSRIGQSLPAGVRLAAKAEWFNPGGSIKDRPAAQILQSALEAGLLEGKTLLDSSSGNMGIAYATYTAAMGIPLHLVVPANVSPARIAILRAHGVELTLSDPLNGSDGAQQIAEEMAA